MNVLIIEDIEFRQEFLKKKVGYENVDCTKHADKALEMLKDKNYDIVFLDHDLIGMRSGSYLTKIWYDNKNEYKTQKPIVIIHSMNMEGATVMENYLKGISIITERIPFKLIVREVMDIKKVVEELIEKASGM